MRTILGDYLQLDGAWAIYLDKPLVTFDIPGDFNGNSTVEQADLDLVLLNWGEDTATLPDTWTGPPAAGAIVDQDELDQVLLNWGNTSTSGVTTAAVPEPGALMLLATCWAGLALASRQAAKRRHSASRAA